MRIAVVGATGRIGGKLTRKLLQAGHQVRAMSRGGAALDELVGAGAEPFIGSFDEGTGEFDRFFDDADAAFLMVKTSWEDLHGHYPAVALRFFDALRDSPVKKAVSLTGMGSEVAGSTGHFQGFYILDQVLNRLRDLDLVHLQGGWFMENLFAWLDAVARHDRIGFSIEPSLKTPWVAIQDIAEIAAEELTSPTSGYRVVRELGWDLTMPEIAAIIGREIGRDVRYKFVDRTQPSVEAEFRQRFGTLEKWLDDSQTINALNDGRVKFGDERVPLSTTMEEFVRDTWVPLYRKVAIDGGQPETFQTWSSQA